MGDRFRAAAASAVVLALFLAGLSWWWTLRRGTGMEDYSSFRADPKGARVLYEALDAMGVDVARSRKRVPPDAPDATILCLGFSPFRFAEDETAAQALAGSAARGGRVVVAFGPRFWLPGCTETEADAERPEGESPEEEPCPAEPAKSGAKAPGAGKEATLSRGFARVWGAEVVTAGTSTNAVRAELVPGRWSRGMPAHLSLHTPLRLSLGPGWQAVYAADGEPVAAQRPFGKGTLVLLADSFWLSNEALSVERRPAFLAWVLGNPGRVVFEEAHLGAAEGRGVMLLVRKYRLEVLLAGLAFAAALLVWRLAVPLVPPREPPPEPETARDGYKSLLERRLPPEKALALVREEVRRGAVLSRMKPEDKKRLVTLRPGKDPVEDYLSMARLAADLCRRLKGGRRNATARRPRRSRCSAHPWNWKT
ncbi:MAG: hypothetical protein JRI97_02435 [Deltaproteobacteria bacterium]|nr:hypothetical protein [Deltaproteobacteria bacterium]